MANKNIAYYNEIEPAAAHVLECLIKDQVIADGVVDRRSIAEVDPKDLAGFRQAHFFAGGGLWSVAARMAGWPDDRPLWTGSCPCQPFSVAGKGAGEDDPRHLWPHFFRLIRACRPPLVVGEQVAGAAGYRWFDGVASDLEGEDYACRAVDIPACAVDAPHIRSRLYWCAVADAVRAAGWQDPRSPSCNEEAHGRAGWDWSEQDSHHRPSSNGESNDCAVGDALSPRGHARHGDDRRQPGRLDADASGSVAETGSSDMEHAEGVGRGEGRAEHEVRGGGLASSSAGGGYMADASGGFRPHGLGEHGQAGQHVCNGLGPGSGSRERDHAARSDAVLSGDAGKTRVCDMADADELGSGEERQQRGGQFLRAGEDTRARNGGDMADAEYPRPSRAGREPQSEGAQHRAFNAGAEEGLRRNGSFWSDYEWLSGADGKARRAQPGICLLVARLSDQLDALRAIERQAWQVVVDHGAANDRDPYEVLRVLREGFRAQARRQKEDFGVRCEFRETQVLLDFMFCCEATRGGTVEPPVGTAPCSEARRRIVRSLRAYGSTCGPPCGWRPDEQFIEQSSDSLLALSFILARLASAYRQATLDAYAASNRVSLLRIAGNAIVPQLAAEVIKALMESLP